ncbi:MAG: hypothetical protein WC332_00235 [Clostridia bacterium]|jgi:hypothetical protein
MKKVISACLGCSYYDRIKIIFDTQTQKQMAKWLLLHERQRHIDDIASIDDDLKLLADVELPREIEDLAGNIRFEIKDKPETLFSKYTHDSD